MKNNHPAAGQKIIEPSFSIAIISPSRIFHLLPRMPIPETGLAPFLFLKPPAPFLIIHRPKTGHLKFR
jgi:hypothetical protein